MNTEINLDDPYIDYLSEMPPDILFNINIFLSVSDGQKLMTTSKTNTLNEESFWFNTQNKYYPHSKIPLNEWHNIRESIIISFFYQDLMYFNTTESRHINYKLLKDVETKMYELEVDDKVFTMLMHERYKIIDIMTLDEVNFYSKYLQLSKIDKSGHSFIVLKKKIDIRFFGYDSKTLDNSVLFENDMKWIDSTYTDRLLDGYTQLNDEYDIRFEYNELYEDEDIIFKKRLIPPYWYNQLRYDY
jgi:hypothetical protein